MRGRRFTAAMSGQLGARATGSSEGNAQPVRAWYAQQCVPGAAQGNYCGHSAVDRVTATSATLECPCARGHSGRTQIEEAKRPC
jgi:hypothetical protein